MELLCLYTPKQIEYMLTEIEQTSTKHTFIELKYQSILNNTYIYHKSSCFDQRNVFLSLFDQSDAMTLKQ